MPLDPTQQRVLVEWLDQKQVQPQCPACGTQHDWSPGDIVAAPVYKPGGLHLGSELTPLVEVICNYCGHVRFFAATPIGLYKKERREKGCEGAERTKHKPFTISA